MDFVNLMFLGMAGMIVFLSCLFISNWVHSRKSNQKNQRMPQFIPPRKPTISGNGQSADAAVEFNYRMADWQQKHRSVSRHARLVAGQKSYSAAGFPGEVEGTVPRVH